MEYEPVRNTMPPTYTFKSGYRSKLEISKKSVLEFVCQIYGGDEVCKPEEWNAQYADAQREEQAAGNDSDQDDTLEASRLYENRRNDTIAATQQTQAALGTQPARRTQSTRKH